MTHVDFITGQIIDAAVELHRQLGPGLFESVYETLLAKKLERRGFTVERQKQVEFDFDGIHFKEGLRIDLLIDGLVIVELKSVEKVATVHLKQMLTYLRLMKLPVGLVINFGADTLIQGLHRVVNGYQPPRLRVRNRLPVQPTRPEDSQ